MREGDAMNAPASASRSSPQEEKTRFTAVNNTATNGSNGAIVVGHHRPAPGASPANTPNRPPAGFEDWSESAEHTSSYKRKRTPEPVTPLHQTTSYAQHHAQPNSTAHHSTVLSHPTHESGVGMDEDMNVGHGTMDDTFSERGNGDEESKLVDSHGLRLGEGSPQAPGQDGGEAKKRKRQFANRTKTGCITCRRRKKKCDEGKPECTNCRRGGFVCEGYTSKVSWPKPATKGSQPVSIQSKVEIIPSASVSPSPSTIQPVQQHTPVHLLLSTEPNSIATFSPQQRPLHLEREPVPVTSNARIVPPPVTPQPTQDFSLQRTQQPAPSTPAPVLSFSRGPSPGPAGLLPSGENMTEKQKMLEGLPYLGSSPELMAERDRCKVACYRFNNALMLNSSRNEQWRLFVEILRPDGQYEGVAGGMIEDVDVEMPFHCSYGTNISLGKEVRIGPGCTIMDSGQVTIMERTVLDADVKIYTTVRSSDPRKRQGGKGPETAKRVIIQEDCLIGGNVTILAGVTISRGAVIGAGSVVSRDVPPYTVVAGNPATVIRGLYANGVEM